MTVYNKQTAALFRESTHVALASVSPALHRNEDGTTDIYFGPEAPAGHESNWLETPAGSGWWPWFRFFGPEEPLFDKTWNMPDIDKLN